MRHFLFALASIALLWSASCSNGDHGVVDENNPPSRITDLAVAQVTAASVTLRWTAPAGGGDVASASSYDLRCAASTVTAANWDGALECEGEPNPGAAGSTQSMLLTGLPADTVLYFAMRSSTEDGLWSEVSNSPVAVVPPISAVAFADSALEATIREILEQPEGEITHAALLGVTVIEAAHRGIRSLSGIENCPTLHRLIVQGNEISDLSPLANLVQLSELDASSNAISDIEPLSDLTGMNNLSLSGNTIVSIGAVARMEMLNFLWLADNQIADLSPIAGCVRLNHLFLSGNAIVDLAALGTSKYLSDLDLARNRIVDLAPLVANANFADGDRIWITDNPLSATAVDVQIPALRARGVEVNSSLRR